MKLVDILARELKVWPELGRKLCQGHKGRIYQSSGGDTYAITERADDWELAEVSRDEWQAAVDALKAEKVVEWSGEGLPPVGTVCEYLGAHQYNEWSEVKIFGSWRNFVFVDFTDGWRQEDNPKRFRPIRTPEQIAAEERSNAIDEMVAVYKSNYEGHAKDGCQALYDAGYRKFEIVDN